MFEVFFADFRAETPSQNVPRKIHRLSRMADFGQAFRKGDLVAVKTHSELI